MQGLDWFTEFTNRLQGYPLWQVAVELLIIGVIVYAALRFLQGTRAAGALGATILLLVVATVAVRLASQRDLFPRLSQLYTRFIGFLAIALVVVFQPELRRALLRMGELPAIGPLLRGMQGASDSRTVVEAVVRASEFLSKNKFGAIIAIERRTGMRELVEGATILDADVSAALLESIFWPSNPLHDMGVLIRGRKIVAAGVQFPLADPAEVRDPTLGTRHRAAVGLSRATDAFVVVVSEETGAISIAERGRLTRWLTPEALTNELNRALRSQIEKDPHTKADEPPPETGFSDSGMSDPDGERPANAESRA